MPAERRGPAVRNSSDNKGGRGGMIKTPIDLQDLRRKIYTKAKADTAWRFWGLYVLICKMKTSTKLTYWLRRKTVPQASMGSPSRPSKRTAWRHSSSRFRTI